MTFTTRGEYIASVILDNDLSFGAELGVRNGRTLATILELTDCCMIAVDLWEPIPNDLESYEGWDFPAYERKVREISAHFPGRVTILKSSTHEASKEVADDSLDFVFIDADHSYEKVKADIRDWTPKVRPGGFIIGHDWNWPSVRKAAEESFECVEGPDNVWMSRLSV